MAKHIGLRERPMAPQWVVIVLVILIIPPVIWNIFWDDDTDTNTTKKSVSTEHCFPDNFGRKIRTDSILVRPDQWSDRFHPAFGKGFWLDSRNPDAIRITTSGGGEYNLGRMERQCVFLPKTRWLQFKATDSTSHWVYIDTYHIR